MRRYLGIIRPITPHLLRGFSSSVASPEPPDDPFDGFTRSIHMKKQFVEVKQLDGSVKKVPSGLVDNSKEWIGDAMVRYQLKMTANIDWTMEGFAERARKRLLERHKRRQVITAETIEKRGSLDLAVAHMVCNLGGRVQFVGDSPNRWRQRYNKGPPDLPPFCSDDLKLEAIDLSGTAIMYEGLTRLPQLTHLKILRLRRCLYLNDHCLSLVGQITESPLEYLDISECHRITANGITTLTELKSLQRLLLQGNPTLEDRELVCLLLEEYLPKVYIEGVDYLGNLPEAAKQRVLALDSSENDSLLTEHVAEEAESLRVTSK
ncbi:unnamed protein product [Mesocestoides corti]|uniref:ATP synthase subunit s, mitochondrial n=1 Tax=Mesocestoides corti TaxID=53468 RepID=A0A0R3UED2_MESCO|nr:unnamed protein product [Mesocestoides corti]